MKKIMTKAFAVLLCLAMLFNICPAYAAVVVNGTNDGTIYLSLDFYKDIKTLTKATEFAANDTFYVEFNFSGNPTTEKETMTGFSLAVGYDCEKMALEKAVKGANGAVTPEFNKDFATGVFSAVGGFASGLQDDYGDILTSGTLFYVQMKAKTALTASDLNKIVILKNAQGEKEVMDTSIVDGVKEQFTVIQTPAIQVGSVSGNIYSDTSASEIKAMISSISFINNSGEKTEYKNTSSAWSRLSISLPTGGLKVGKNTLTASFDGYECEFEVEVLDRLASIAVTTAPSKTTYTAFEKFDKTGMVVTATYESARTEVVTEDCVVDTTTELKVSDTAWKVTYEGKQTTTPIKVNPLQVTKPVVSADMLTYNGSEQTISYSVEPDSKYVSISGATTGKDAKTYTATASLKDKSNTVWATDAGTANLSLTWKIEKASVVSGIAPMTKKYTTTYAELPDAANVTGVNGETVEADIAWYTDAACNNPASANAQIVDSYTGDNQSATLYYKATGMNNYLEYKGAVSVAIVDKDAANVDWKQQPSGWSYSNNVAEGTYSADGYTLTADMFAIKDQSGNTLTGTNKTITITNDQGVVVDKLTDVGTYNVLITYEDKDNKASETFTAKVNAKSIEGYVVSLRVGAGEAVETTTANPLEVAYTAAEIAPEVVAVAGIGVADYTVESEAVGTVVKATNVGDTYKIAIKGTGNYTGTTYAYWKIVPAELEVTAAEITEKVYNGRADDANVVGVTFSGLKGNDSLTIGSDYVVVSATYADKNVADNASATVEVALADTAVAKNYTLKTASVQTNGRITQAAAPSLSAPATQTLLSSSVDANSRDYAFNLPTVISGIPADAGTVTYTVKSEGAYAKKIGTGVDGGVLKLNVAQPQEAAVTDAVVITVSSTNYADADVTVNFEFRNKTAVTVTLADTTATYGEDYTIAGSYADQPQSGYTWTYVYEGINGTEYAKSSEKPLNAGTYLVTASYEDDTPDQVNPDIPGHIGMTTAELVIEPKMLAITDGDVSITKVFDETVAAGALNGALGLEGKVGDDEVSIDMTSVVVGQYATANVGTYTVELSGLTLSGAAKDNYTIPATYSFANAKITKKLQSALQINGSNEAISATFGDEPLTIVLSGGNGEGAYDLTSSDTSVVSLTAVDATTWQASVHKAGSVNITATKLGDENYEAAEAATVAIEVAAKTIVADDFVIDTEAKTFTGSEIQPSVTSEVLVVGVDYDVVYSANANVGTANITITGKGNYQGEVTVNFEIAPKNLTEDEFAVLGLEEAYAYNGAAISPVFGVNWGTILLTAGTDYDVEYSNNLAVGVATITITGKGNYAQTLVKEFEIVSAEYTGSVTITSNDATIAVGSELIANAPSGDILTYQWKRDGVAIEGAVDAVYVVTEDDNDANISVEVTSSGNYVGTLESAAVVVGKAVLSASVLLDDTDPTTIALVIENVPAEENYEIVWLRNNAVINGENGASYVLTGDDYGCEISAKLVAIGDIYTGEVLSSNSVIVPAIAPTFASTPVVSAGNLQATVNYKVNVNGSAVISYQILVDGNVVATLPGTQTNYTITNLVNGTAYAVKVIATNAVGSTESVEVTVTPKKPFQGGGAPSSAATTYAVSTQKVSGGSISANLSKAKPGAKVSITVKPDKGYELESIVILDKNGKEITITRDGNVITFTMPSSKVTIEPKFEKIEEKPPVDDPQEGEDKEIAFEDVPATSYYASAVEWAVKNGITNGTGDVTFSPEAQCTRAQMVTFLWRAAGSPKAENAKTLFADIDSDSYYYDAVLWAVENGITAGLSETSFGPDATVDRAQTVTFIWRLANSPVVSGESKFEDVSADMYYEDAVAWAVGESITNGISETSFGPDSDCTRAQIVTFLYRYFVK